ncbi:MAG: hypothetical protein DRN15_04525 [Thermoprotei archaeon]|nr:MAG: hypothetical protein DRM97_06305 [Thermoprotei archaeon]RLF23978.1 MAG: hypothetical protein DRN15_04525 [Thermoprotei archaeon]
MGRRSLAEEVITKVKDIQSISDDCIYLVVYDFHVEGSSRIPISFYRNVSRIRELLGDGTFIQKSVIECNSLKTALALAFLARYYGATVRVYQVRDQLDVSSYL